MPRVLVDGLHIEYAEEGAGEPVVLLHGGMDDHRSWRWQLEGLADAFRVIAWDQPGCGRSDDPPEDWTIADFADCVVAWMRALDIDRPHLLGLSWGSSVALALCDRRPDVPASLMLASSYLGWSGTLTPEEVAARVDQLLAEPDPTRAQLVEESGSYFGGEPPAALMDELIDNWLDNTPAKHPAGFRATLHAMARADLRDIPPRIRVPTLLVHGEKDQRSPVAKAQDLHEQIPSSRLVVIPDAGHLCNAEAPDEFNRAVRDFLGLHAS